MNFSWYSLLLYRYLQVSKRTVVFHSAKKGILFLDPFFLKRKSSLIYSSKKTNASWFKRISLYFSKIFPQFSIGKKFFATQDPWIPPFSHCVPNMAPPLDDGPYCLLSSCEKLETFNEWFRRKCPKTPIFDT